MLKLAFKILVANKTKYMVIVLGLGFSVFFIIEQLAVFTGLLEKTYNFVSDNPEVDIWITNPLLKNLETILPLKDSDLEKIRSLEEIKWAMPYARGLAFFIRKDNKYQPCHFIGLDNATLIGGPLKMLDGKLEYLKTQNAIIVNNQSLPKSQKLKKNDLVTLNKCQAKVVGTCESTSSHLNRPIIFSTYSTYSKIISCVTEVDIPETLNFIMAKAKKNVDIDKLCSQIKKNYNLKAFTKNRFKHFILKFYLTRGISLNFGVTTLLGLILGLTIAGRYFYDFIVTNIRFLALFKVMGAQNNILIKMTLFQFAWVGFISWTLGTGIASFIGFIIRNKTALSFKLSWQLYLFSIFSILLICIISTIFSIRKIMKVEPAIIFQT